ncbi:MAG: glycosyltransferase [Candidatus Mariimomonas ferrooxydans]
MEEKTPLVSIIVRTKDRPKLLNKALQSIASQTYMPIEVVLVNDGGCDLPEEELKEILGNVSLNYIRLKENRGRAGAGNVGIENAKGGYIGFLDDDDEFYPEHVSLLVSFLEETDYKIAYSDSLMVFKEGFSAETNELIDAKKELAFSRDFDYDSLLFENYIPFMCLLFDRDVLINSDGFDNNFDLYEDWDLLIRIGERSPFCHVRKITSNYNQWSSIKQISQRNKDYNFLDQSYFQILTKHRDKITPARIHKYISAYTSVKLELRNKYAHIANLKDHIVSLEKSRDAHIANLEATIRDMDSVIVEMKNTLGWRILEKYRRIRDRIFSTGSGIKGKSNLISKGLIILKNEGFTSLLKKINKEFIKKPRTLYRPIDISNISINISERPILTKVSIIIPTKNAGEEFDYILQRVIQQEGVKDIELIIIDSCSQDRTIDISKSYTQNIFQISAEDFHHGRTRNLGAEKATGDYLVFMVQDAIPVGNQWLYKLCNPIHQGIASAVSPRQIPRSDADLFASWAYWAHYKYLGYNQDHIRDKTFIKNFDNLDIKEKRTLAGLDNVCLGIRKETFESHQFNSDFAEDLELGIKLIKDDHVLMFQSSNAVIHSHNRDAMYFLKRSYVDIVSLSNILRIARKNMSAESVLEALSYFYCKLKKCIFELNIEKASWRDPKVLIHSLIHDLNNNITSFDPSWQSLKGDPLLDEYFANIPVQNHRRMISAMNSVLISNLWSFSDFLTGFDDVKNKVEDFQESLYKFFANMAGYYLGTNSPDNISSLYEGV